METYTILHCRWLAVQQRKVKSFRIIRYIRAPRKATDDLLWDLAPVLEHRGRMRHVLAAWHFVMSCVQYTRLEKMLINVDRLHPSAYGSQRGCHCFVLSRFAQHWPDSTLLVALQLPQAEFNKTCVSIEFGQLLLVWRYVGPRPPHWISWTSLWPFTQLQVLAPTDHGQDSLLGYLCKHRLWRGNQPSTCKKLLLGKVWVCNHLQPFNTFHVLSMLHYL